MVKSSFPLLCVHSCLSCITSLSHITCQAGLVKHLFHSSQGHCEEALRWHVWKQCRWEKEGSKSQFTTGRTRTGAQVSWQAGWEGYFHRRAVIRAVRDSSHQSEHLPFTTLLLPYGQHQSSVCVFNLSCIKNATESQMILLQNQRWDNTSLLEQGKVYKEYLVSVTDEGEKWGDVQKLRKGNPNGMCSGEPPPRDFASSLSLSCHIFCPLPLSLLFSTAGI